MFHTPVELNSLLLSASRAPFVEDVPGAMVHGRWDLGAPLGNAWALKRAWPQAELVVVDDAGHSATPGSIGAIVEATDRYAGLG